MDGPDFVRNRDSFVFVGEEMKGALKSIFIRTIGLSLICLVGVLLLWYPIEQSRLDGRVKMFLLEVQTALQGYHVKEELYPEKPMPGRQLIALLVKEGFLKAYPENPWTQKPYSTTNQGKDWLRYRTDESAEIYELITFFPETDEVHFRLDSIENHSLEED